jgi:hypothetical protein
MMALNNPGTNTVLSSLSSRSMISSKGHTALRRRRSKGTIAGFAFKGSDAANPPQSTPEVNGETVGPSEHNASINGSSTSGQGNQPQHTSDSSSASAKPCHAARLALLCSQNAIKMGARTQLGLCPPGRARRDLQTALRKKTRTNRSVSAKRPSLQGNMDAGGYFGIEKMLGVESCDGFASQEEEYLNSANTFDVESDEEASSGDEDELNDIDDLLKEDAPALDDEKKYANLREPLFTPIGSESSLSNSGGPMGGGTGKLPFNRRKVRFFDAMTATDRMAARAYLNQETRKSKRREALLLSRHLRRMQKKERRRIKQERGDDLDTTDMSDQENDDPKERALLAGVSQFDEPMTPAISAALLVESLSLNPLESLEGMAKCYDGIVAAGVALLEGNVNDPTSPRNDVDKSARSRSEIMAALTPLLITSLEQPAGEVILSLAKLRRMCGTARYQRRFIQRIAPSLIRPPRGAMWCLKHQNDMELILAAAELIFDSAFEIFSKGWYDRGQLLLADSKRAETLNTAAMQLRNLSTEPNDNLTLGFSGHSTWRGSKFKAGSAPIKDGSKASNGPLAEWEVIAVDRQIRISISNLIAMDWSRVVVNSKDNEMSKSYHRSRSTAASKRPAVLPQSSSGDMSPSPKAIPSSPHSPARPSNVKAPLSPPVQGQLPGSGPQTTEDSFPNAFSDSATSAKPSQSSLQATPLSPLPPNRSGMDDLEPKVSGDQYSPSTNIYPPSAHTPPRSPNPNHSPKRDTLDMFTSSLPYLATQSATPLSPRRINGVPGGVPIKESISNQGLIVPISSPSNPQFGGDKERAPLSPSSVGTNASADIVPFRPVSSASSVASISTSGSQTAHYRMLTSTAAERKRTVAACRALRAQITRFEDAFIQLHGRPPKGAAERAPLATTYAQYREWKRAIRADAACRIQALFRGARARWMLLRSNNPRMSRVVLSRAGRSKPFEHGERLPAAGQDNVLTQLSIPVEIGEPEPDRNQNASNRAGPIVPISGGKPFSEDSDMFMQQGQSGGGQSLPPQWGNHNQIVRRRSGSNEGFSGSPAAKPFPSPSSSALSASYSQELIGLPISDLLARKRDLKQQLKQYDMNFARKLGRMPVKAEKEPIRHLYENYNSLKSQITLVEQEGRQMVSPVSIQQPAAAVLPQRTVSPVSSGPDSGEDSPVGRRGNRKQSTPPPLSQVSPSAGASPTTPSGSSSQDISSHKAEKGKLHQMLRSYEKEFFKEHKRQVSSFADIKPVASQYRRYKEIKKTIATLQQGGDK